VKKVGSAARPWVAATAVAAGLFCLVVVVIPLAESHGFAGAAWMRLALRPACHQIADRCLDLGAGPLAVCARCSGLYAGGFAGLLLTALTGRRMRPRFRTLVASAIPSAIDFAAGLLGLPGLANWPRFGLAVIPGIVLGLLLADAVCAVVELNTDESAR
jgi:uncharacterized membrane protein